MKRQSFKRTLRLARTIALPVTGGLAIFAILGAPRQYAAVNAGAFLLGLAVLHLVRIPNGEKARRAIALLLLAILALPLLFGPELDGARRWLMLGPLALNSGLLLAPLICVLAMSDRAWGWLYPTAGIVIAALQIDAALALAFSAALLAWAYVKKDWRGLPPALLGAVACLFALRSGGPPPVPFVEGLLEMAWDASPLLAFGLATSLFGLPILVLREGGLPVEDRLVLAVVFLAFTANSLLGDYPVPLAGYGASAILGFMLALAASAKRTTGEELPET